jgi:hypothetical protein
VPTAETRQWVVVHLLLQNVGYVSTCLVVHRIVDY